MFVLIIGMFVSYYSYLGVLISPPVNKELTTDVYNFKSSLVSRSISDMFYYQNCNFNILANLFQSIVFKYGDHLIHFQPNIFKNVRMLYYEGQFVYPIHRLILH
jgi:hypothetical protein